MFRDRAGFRREDISEDAWQQIKESVAPFSFWKSKFQAPPPAAPEAMPKESVEELLRRLIREDLPEHLNARYVLAILLERKRTLKQVDIRETAEDKILIYEHVKTGEAFIIPGSAAKVRSARFRTTRNLFAPGREMKKLSVVSSQLPVETVRILPPIGNGKKSSVAAVRMALKPDEKSHRIRGN